MMVKQGRGQSGKFAPKSDEPRSVRTMRLTDTAWAKLGEIADSRGITRADLIEEWSRQGTLQQTSQLTIFDTSPVEPSSEKGERLKQVELKVTQVLNDPVITRNGKDRGSIKRAMQALINLLS